MIPIAILFQFFSRLGNSLLPTPYSLLPTPHSPLPTPYSPLPTIFCGNINVLIP
ncbi:MAG: hypothetical protein DSM106950_09940 [Stigonema ocellatum SAG 48.90 = DSM 106950]|nr:hypothetical protein [Stigonema ocellatum SAG 48.90 = DSM 106950]